MSSSQSSLENESQPKRRRIETESSRSLDPNLNQFFQEGFKVVTSNLVKVDNPSNEFCKPDPLIIFRSHAQHPEKIFLAVNRKYIFEYLAEQANQAMERKKTQKLISQDTAKKYYNRPITGTEILQAFCLRLLFRERAANDTLKDQFEDESVHSEWPMTIKRFEVIMSCLSCDFSDFSKLLHKSWSSCVDPGRVACVDEAMFSFYSQVDKTSPQR